MKKYLLILLPVLALIIVADEWPAGEEALGTKKYNQYEKPEVCQSCRA